MQLSRTIGISTTHRCLPGVVYLAAVVLLLSPSLLGSNVAVPADILHERLPWEGGPLAEAEAANRQLRDVIDQYYPVQRVSWERLQAGQDATWIRDLAFGVPGVQFVGHGALSPFNWPALVVPFDTAWDWGMALRLLAAMAGAHLLARSYGVSRPAATVTGLAFGLSAFMVLWLGWPQSHTAAWIPWVCWAARHAALSSVGVWTVPALAGATAALWLGGFPAVAVYGLLTAGVVAVHAAVTHRGTWWHRLGRLKDPAIGVALGTGVVAFTLLPSVLFLEEIDLSARAEAWRARVPLPALVTFVSPDAFGRGVDFALPPAYIETVGYAGVVTVLLGLAAVTLRPRQRGIGLWTTVLIGALAMAYGLPPVPRLLSHLPLFSTNPPPRMLSVAGLALAVLAAFGVDSLRRRLKGAAPPQRPVAIAVATGVAGAFILLAMARPGTRVSALLRPRLEQLEILDRVEGVTLPRVQSAVATAVDSLATSGGLIAATILLVLVAWKFAPRLGGHVQPLVGVGLVALVAVDLLVFASGWNTHVPRAVVDARPEAISVVAERSGDHRAVGVDEIGLPNTHLLDGFADLRAHTFVTSRQREILASAGAEFITPTVWKFPSQRSEAWEPWLSAMSVATVFAPPDMNQPVTDSSVGQSSLVADEVGGVTLIDNPDAVPRVYAVGTATRMEGGHAGTAVEQLGEEEVLDDQAVIEGGHDGSLPDGSGSAEVAEWRADGGRIEATVRSEEGAVLIATDAALDGWRATIDESSAEVVVANHLFLGVVVPPGEHEVTLTHRSPGLVTGAGISAAALLLLGGWTGFRVFARARRRS